MQQKTDFLNFAQRIGGLMTDNILNVCPLNQENEKLMIQIKGNKRDLLWKHCIGKYIATKPSFRVCHKPYYIICHDQKLLNRQIFCLLRKYRT